MTWRLAPGSCLADRYDIVRSIGHGGHGVVGVGLNRLDDGGNLLGSLAGALGQPLYLFRHHREPPSGFTG